MALGAVRPDLLAARQRDLDGLLGLRSSKGRYYVEYRHSRHDLERTLAAVNAVSWLLASTRGDPDRIVAETLPVVAGLLDARGIGLVGHHPGLGGAVAMAVGHPTLGALDRGATAVVLDPASRLPDHDPREGAMRHVPELAAGLLVVPFPRGGQVVGSVAALVPDHVRADTTDLAILGTLTNQLTVAVESAWRLAESERLRSAAASAAEDAAAKATALERRNDMLRQTRYELVAARELQVLSDERQRIARDLHDSVAQHVLSMGMQVEACRAESTEPAVVERLVEIKDLARSTVHRIREAIFELAGADELEVGLVPALRRLADQHRVSGLAVSLRVTGAARPLPSSAERALYMAAKEALFNTVIHADATRVSVHLAVGADEVRLRVTDDGTGSAAALRACLDRARRSCEGGYHRGLGNIDERARLVGGRVEIADAPGRGVRLQVVVPVEGGRA